jgi:carbon-monoxide dehydrogenase small subunit
MNVRLQVNGAPHQVSVEPHDRLVDVLREELGFRDVKMSCGEGSCGACTVLVNGRPVNACMMLAVLADGMAITTVGGLARDGELDPLQAKFIEHGAVQCGYCTPGMILSAHALLESRPDPTEAEVRRALSGNICRCTGYQQIVEAVLSAAEDRRCGGRT